MDREAFEKWWNESDDMASACLWKHDTPIQFAWEAWQAAKADSAAQVEALQRDADRYRWLKNNAGERLTARSGLNEFSEHKTEFVFPQLISWANFCGFITLDEAIDYKIAASTTAAQKENSNE